MNLTGSWLLEWSPPTIRTLASGWSAIMKTKPEPLPLPKPIRRCTAPFSALWLAGAAGFFLYGAVSYVLLKRRLRFAVKDEVIPGVWYSDRIPSPCVAGLFRPQIYLTFGLTESEKSYILAHERQHIKNGDHIWKVLAWLIMCVHWFNAFLWPLFYRAFLSQVEDACDQRVLRQLGEDKKADYGQVLLTLSAGRRFRLSPSPIAFGEGDTKSRVKVILRYKKPIAAISALALVAAVAAGVLPAHRPRPGPGGEGPRRGPSTGSSSVQTGGRGEEGFGTYQIYDLHPPDPRSVSTDKPQLPGRAAALRRGIHARSGSTSRRRAWRSSDPVYQEIELGSQLILGPNGVETATALVSSPEEILGLGGVCGRRTARRPASRSTWQGCALFVGKWVSHGTVSPTSGYWYLMGGPARGGGGDAGGHGACVLGRPAGRQRRIRLALPVRREPYPASHLQCDNGALTYDGLDTPGTDLTVVGTPPRTQVDRLSRHGEGLA